MWGPCHPLSWHVLWDRFHACFGLVLFWVGLPLPDPLPQLPFPLRPPPSGLRYTSLLITCRHSALDHDKLRQFPSKRLPAILAPLVPRNLPLGITRSPVRSHHLKGALASSVGRDAAVIPGCAASHQELTTREGSRRALWGPFVSAGKFCFGLSQTHPPATASHSWSFLSRKREQD